MDSIQMIQSTRSESKMLSAAVQYAENGFKVIPCVPNGKSPVTKNGCKDATDDVDQIEKWWTQTPDANIGIATDGLVVVDIDGEDHPWLADPDRMAELAKNAMAVTPRGGRHLYFAQGDEEIRNSASKLADKVDIRANGGYVVAPPSIVNGKEYRWSSGFELGHRSELDVVPESISGPLRRPKNDQQQPVEQDGIFSIADKGEALTILARLPLDCCDNRDDWLRVGMALHSVSPLLLSDWVSWSKLSAKFQPGVCERSWRGFDRDRADGVGIGTLRHLERKSRPEREPRLTMLDASTFALTNYRQRYLVKGVLAEGQPMIVAGQAKTLKTTIMVDLLLSLATGTPFLGKFDVPEPKRVGVYSGESGGFTLQETCNRVCFTKGVNLQEASNFHISFNLPRLSLEEDAHEMQRVIQDLELDVIVVDPMYLALLTAENAGQATNSFAMGEYLSKFNEIGQQHNCTVVALAHTRKSRPVDKRFEPVELEEISMAGFAEWARQWLLIGRREEYEPGTGEHRLWLNVGGSAGHGNLWGCDIDEGTFDDYGGRKWCVDVLNGSEIRQDERRRRADAKAERVEEKIADYQTRLMAVLRSHPDGETPSALAGQAGINYQRAQSVLFGMLQDEIIEKCDIQKAGRKTPYEGYKLSKLNHSDSPTDHSDSLF